MTLHRPATDSELDAIEAHIDEWLQRQLDENPMLVAVDRGEPGERRWYVRLRGEEKDFTTIWLTLGQRTLHYETYVMPAPEENQEQFYEHLLRRNAKLVGAQFCVGARTRSTSSAPSRPALSTTPSSIASWVRSTRASSSASARPCSSGSPRDFALDVSVHFMSFCCRPEGGGITGSGKSGESVRPRAPRGPHP